MTKELKAQLFDEVVSWLDNDDTLRVDKGTLISHGGKLYDYSDEKGENPFYTIEEALTSLGYEI